MFLLPLLLVLQSPAERAILQAEYARAENVSVLEKALKSPDSNLQRLAVRAMGRLERPALAGAIVPLLRHREVRVRGEAVAALSQMGAAYDFGALIGDEKDGNVRAIIYESIGRTRPLAPGSEALLVAGLKDQDSVARTGAARGLETLIRLNIRTTRPQPTTLDALRQAFRDNQIPQLREFALLALNTAGDQDSGVFDIAMRDPEPQVRRLAVIGSKRWVDDPAPMVRLEALRLAGNCERAFAAVDDHSGHVVLAAVDVLGAQKCDAVKIAALVDQGKTWRVRSRALVSLAKVSPDAARQKLGKFRVDPIWQVRVYAATAAGLAKDDGTLEVLAGDPNPNVAAAAMTTGEQALRALSSDHSGLLLAAAAKLKGSSLLKSSAPEVLAALLRITASGRVTVRDERVKLIELLDEGADPAVIEKLRTLLSDRDPVVAAAVAKTLSAKTGAPVEPKTERYVPDSFPSETTLRALSSAHARVVMKGLGEFRVALLNDEAPVTVATFAALAEKGAYNGLTFHRVVPNFVLQGGSPGADEYDSLTSQFMRDEVGFTSNARGTLGVSTRGHDTGDGQIFVNLVDNWRLDHTYTVFAQVMSGMDVVDRILEGDVIESITIERGRR